jgi:predicted  nucleic acid-binding Zn-ribbon protein
MNKNTEIESLIKKNKELTEDLKNLNNRLDKKTTEIISLQLQLTDLKNKNETLQIKLNKMSRFLTNFG